MSSGLPSRPGGRVALTEIKDLRILRKKSRIATQSRRPWLSRAKTNLGTPRFRAIPTTDWMSISLGDFKNGM
jgi:hypothetical protein